MVLFVSMDDANKIRRITVQRTRAGKIGGKRSLETMTPEQRMQRAKKAVAAREAKRKNRIK